jgi:hypothetical protein
MLLLVLYCFFIVSKYIFVSEKKETNIKIKQIKRFLLKKQNKKNGFKLINPFLKCILTYKL